MNSADVTGTHAAWAVGGETQMNRRSARNQTEIDFLPPFGEPEVVTTGNAAADLAFAGLAISAGLTYLASN